MKRVTFVGAILAVGLACGGGMTDPNAPKNDLTGLSGTWCYLDKYCYTYEGDVIISEEDGQRGKWRQEGDLYISQFGDDAPWVATIEMYTPTQLVVVPLDDNVRIVYSKR